MLSLLLSDGFFLVSLSLNTSSFLLNKPVCFANVLICYFVGSLELRDSDLKNYDHFGASYHARLFSDIH